jgi:glycosyltransferase involved in cell wall biosynthesis
MIQLSIITINLNNASGLEKTIRSVVKQKNIGYEFIVIDGASIDGSVKVIEQYKTKIDYWLSEPDKGIYEAMNKGIKRAQGEYLLMLNSGDWLRNETILSDIFTNLPSECDIFYGDVQWESHGKLLDVRTFPDFLTFQFFYKKSLGHQATFIRRSLHDLVGLYDEKLRFSADWKFFILSICKFNATYKHIPVVISICDSDGFSWNPNFAPVRQAEHNAVLEEHFPLLVEDYRELNRYKDNTIKNWFEKNKITLKKAVKSLINYKARNAVKL